MNILKAENIIKKYKNGEYYVRAVDNVSLNVKKGEFITIIGPSGSGKSTFLHILGGMDSTDSGSVYINDINIATFNEEDLAIFRRRNVGFIFQKFNLIPVMTVEENIKMPVLLDGNRVNESYFEEIVNVLRLNNKVNSYPNQLSGGEQQRVAIARALINRPAVILADEPTGNLDSRNAKEVIELLLYSIKKYNQTLIMITHDTKLATKGDRTLYMDDGRLLSSEDKCNEKLYADIL